MSEGITSCLHQEAETEQYPFSPPFDKFSYKHIVAKLSGRVLREIYPFPIPIM